MHVYDAQTLNIKSVCRCTVEHGTVQLSALAFTDKNMTKMDCDYRDSLTEYMTSPQQPPSNLNVSNGLSTTTPQRILYIVVMICYCCSYIHRFSCAY